MFLLTERDIGSVEASLVPASWAIEVDINIDSECTAILLP